MCYLPLIGGVGGSKLSNSAPILGKYTIEKVLQKTRTHMSQKISRGFRRQLMITLMKTARGNGHEDIFLYSWR